MSNTTCSFDGCNRVTYGRQGLCTPHYHQRRKGQELKPLRLVGAPVSERFWQYVEKTDKCWNWTASLSPHGYGRFNFRGKASLAHRVAYELTHGSPPPSLLDHICHNTQCVNPDHLRPLDKSGNMQNLGGPMSSNTSGYRNVYLDKRTDTWVVELKVNKRKVYIGKYEDVHEAGRVAAQARREYYPFSDW